MSGTQNLSFQQAARELRSHMARSQQAMAGFLGLSMAALRNYEAAAVTTPDARAASAYLLASEMAGRPDLLEVFRASLYQTLGLEQPSLEKQGAAPAASDLQQMAIDRLRILAEMAQLRTHPGAKALLIEPVSDFENRMVSALLACIRAGLFKKFREAVLRALAKPWLIIPEYPELRLVTKEESSDVEEAFIKIVRELHAKKRPGRKERVSA